ncbi:MAG TPA: hypothetical protein VFU15_03720 [Bacteroidia bacterium]|nr:hypothetical protein [Bacteroidia bacterium]
MSEENTTVQPAENAPVSSEETVNTEKKEKKELAKIQVQKIYRLLNGEWDDFAELSGPPQRLDDFYLVFERHLTPEGEIMLETELDMEGGEIQKTVNTFNEKGKLVQQELYNEGVLAEKTIYEYDEKDRVVKETREFEEGFPLTAYFKYDDKDRVIEKRVDDSEGELQKRETYTYDETYSDKIATHNVYDEEDNLSLEESFEWMEKDGEVKASKQTVKDHSLNSFRRTEFFDPKEREDNIGYATFNEREKVVEYVKVVFDEKGREAEEHSFSVNDSDNFKVYYTYDDEDRVVMQEQKQEDKIISKIHRRFNTEGHAEIISVRSFSRGIYVDYYEYKYY